jgi:hypothetical protein
MLLKKPYNENHLIDKRFVLEKQYTTVGFYLNYFFNTIR